MSEREDHIDHVTYNPDTRTLTCSECGILVDFNHDIPKKTGGDKWADHSFGHGIETTSVEETHDDRLDVFEDFLNERQK